MTKVLYGGDIEEREEWCSALREVKPDIILFETPDTAPAGEIDFLIYEPTGPVQDFAPYSNLKAIQSLWAGVEIALQKEGLPPNIPLLRMVEPGLRQGMTEYVLGHVMRCHLGMDQHRDAQNRKQWQAKHPPLAHERNIGILGLGELGVDAAKMLNQIGFNVLGWSRSRKSVPGVMSYAGESELSSFLAKSEILVILLPHTKETTAIINRRTLYQLPRGASVINAGRGPLIDDTALLAALDEGQIAQATLDVFSEEPLPVSHPYWTHPKVVMTPHIASVTRVKSAVKVIADQIERFESGKSFLYAVDRHRGY